MLNRIKETWGKHTSESQSQAMAAFTHPDLLVLDEVGTGYGSDTEQKLLFEVLDARYLNRLPTILVSNLELEGVKTVIGPRIFDRLREDSGQVVSFGWPSVRGDLKPQQIATASNDPVTNKAEPLAA